MRLSTLQTSGWLLTAALAAAPALSDEVVLRNGGRITGVVVEQTPARVVIETGPGLVTLPMSRVERIVQGRSAIGTFGERAAALEPGDVEGWAALARWAEERGLLTQARVAWQRVLALDPRHPDANAGLGRVSLDGVWMSADDAYRARGYVEFEGRWLTPAEHEAALREQAADHAATLAAREAQLRAREAEARAEEAEARAREAEAGAQSDGIPLGYVYGGGYGYGYGYGYGGAGRAYGPGYGPGDRGHRPHPGSPGTQPTPPGRPTPPSHPSTRPSARPTHSSSAPERRQAAILPPASSRNGAR
jgi:hypothetical protein